MAETHARLVAQFFTHLLDGEGRLPCDWIASNVNRLDRTDGDIDTLVARIAGIRTWTYISHRGDWLNDTVHWQNTTRLLEDKLSDALHKRLTARFVDRRTAILMRSLRERRQMEAVVAENGQVEVEGQSVGQLIGLRFSAERAGSRLADKAVSQAAEAALRQEIAARVKQLVDDDADKFSITTKGRILWNGADIAELAAGADVLSPTALMLPNDQLSTEQKEHVAARVSQWLRGYVHEVLKPLFLLQGAQDELSGAARGLAFQLGESLGSLPVAAVATDISTLNDADRKALARFGVRFGVVSIFIPLLLKPKAQLLCGLLWACKEGLALADLPDPARVSHKVDDKQAIPVFEAFGFAAAGGYAIRVDMLERFSADVRRILRETEAVDGEVILPPEILPVLGVGADAAKDIIAHLGYKTRVDEDGALKIRPRRRNRKGGGKPQGQKTAGAPDKDKAPAQAAVPAAASAPEGNGMAAPAADAQPADMAATPAADTPAVEAAPAAADTPKPKAKPKAPVKKRPKKKSVKLSQDVDEDSPFAVLKQLKLKD
jgi:ATP-dependent RNA helicase SUPV3L1/SUV3